MKLQIRDSSGDVGPAGRHCAPSGYESQMLFKPARRKMTSLLNDLKRSHKKGSM